MNISARISKAEKALGPVAGGDPKKIEALFRYLQTGSAADIPEGATFPELQAAARRIPKAAAGKFKGLAELQAALAETLAGTEILGYLEAGKSLVIKTDHVNEDPEPRPEWPAAGLLKRLGFFLMHNIVVNTRARRGDA
jgi:hypothetical protein